MITRIILTTLAGMMLWTLAEYLLHRFLDHVHKGKTFSKPSTCNTMPKHITLRRLPKNWSLESWFV